MKCGLLGRLFLLGGFFLGGGAAWLSAAPWKPVPGRIMSRWARQVQPDKVHAEYPRPLLVRQDWLNLNGLWDYALRPKGDEPPREYDGKILVPFCVESALSLIHI